MSKNSTKQKIPHEFMKRGKNILKLIEESEHTINQLSLDDRICISFTVLEKPQEYRNNLDLKLLSQCTEDIKYFTDLRQMKNGEFIHEMFCKYMQYQYFDKDQFVFEEGDQGTQFYLILQGEVKVTKKQSYTNEDNKVIIEDEKIRLKQGHCFGELALINNKPRAASIKTTQPSYFAVLDRQYYDQILNNVSNKYAFMEKFAQMKMFKDWDNIAIKHLYDLSNEIKITYGNHVYHQGDDSDFLYLIKQGDFQLRKKLPITDHKNKINNNEKDEYMKNDLEDIQRNIKPLYKLLNLNLVQETEYFGEEEIISENKYISETRQYSVVCMSHQGILYSINKLDFQKKVYIDEVFYKNLLKSIYQKKLFRKKQILKLCQEDIQPRFLAEQAKNLIQKKVLNFNLYDQPSPNTSNKERLNNRNSQNSIEIIECFDKQQEKKQINHIKSYEKVVLDNIKMKKPCNDLLKFENEVLNQFYKKYNFPSNITIVTRQKKTKFNSSQAATGLSTSHQQSQQQQQQIEQLTERLSSRFLQKSNEKLNHLKMSLQYQKAIQNYNQELLTNEDLIKPLLTQRVSSSPNNNIYTNSPKDHFMIIQNLDTPITARGELNSQIKNVFSNTTQQHMTSLNNGSHSINNHSNNNANSSISVKDMFEIKKNQQLNKFEKHYLQVLNKNKSLQSQTEVQQKHRKNMKTLISLNEQSTSIQDQNNEILQSINSFTSKSIQNVFFHPAQTENYNNVFSKQIKPAYLQNLFFDSEKKTTLSNQTQQSDNKKIECLPLKYQTKQFRQQNKKKQLSSCFSNYYNIQKVPQPSLDTKFSSQIKLRNH